MPLPDRGFDPTEAAVPWSVLAGAGDEVVIATEQGAVPACDERALRGYVLGRFGAGSDVEARYGRMRSDPAFRAPIRWDGIEPEEFDGLLLPGGHAAGMRGYLTSGLLQERVAAFWRLGRPVGAICHGVLVLARARDAGGRSLLAARRTTCLPRRMERAARLGLVWLGDEVLRLPGYVEDEVRAVLDDPRQLELGPRVRLARGTATDDRAAFVVADGAYVSGRWLGDAYLFARTFAGLLHAARR